MSENDKKISRRSFVKSAGLAMTGALAAPAISSGSRFKDDSLRVWSCGGLAEALMPASSFYEQQTGCKVAYTGAFAAALGKSLLGGSATTEVFAPRVLGLAQKLRKEGKMLCFKPLCFTKYVLVTPKGNPAGIKGIKDMAKPGVRVVLTPDASAPGGAASMIILKKAGILEEVKKNAVVMGDCVQRSMPEIINSRGDVAVVEQRLTRFPQFKGKVDIMEIPEKFIPSKPVPFTIGIMKWARNREIAEDFVRFILSEKGQSYFDKAGFIPALSDEGIKLTKKYGVKDA